MVRAKDVAPEFREPLINLWLGDDAHLVHYPVKGGRIINIVAITADSWNAAGWSEPASRVELLPRLSAQRWAPQALAMVNLPEAWLKWALYEHRPLTKWSKGPVALLGDAAHPMMPFLAQGAAMAIEDAAVVAECLARTPDDPDNALRTYGSVRRGRASRVQRSAARNGDLYHFAGIRGTLRNAAMRVMGGRLLLRHYDWLYDWRPPAAFPAP
jgi:salicylate hydroxylase